MITYNYDINNLFQFKIIGSKKPLDYVNRQYSFFKIDEEIHNPDLEIHIGKFQTPIKDNKNYEIINRKYFVTSDALYCKDAYKVARWEFMVQNLDEEKSKIYFNGNYWSYYLLYKFLIEPVLRFKLNAKKYLMVHSAAISDSSGTSVFAASPSVGKTSTMMNWLHDGKKFVADEYTILSKDNIYSYPTPLRLHDYNLKTHSFIKKNMPQNDVLQILLRSLVFKLTLGYGDITHEVNIEKIFPDVKIVNKSKLKHFFILTKYSGNSVKLKNTSKEDIYKKILIINKFETTRFAEYINAYFYVHTDKQGDFWDQMFSNVKNILEKQKCYEINMPLVYTKKSFDEFNNILSSL